MLTSKQFDKPLDLADNVLGRVTIKERGGVYLRSMMMIGKGPQLGAIDFFEVKEYPETPCQILCFSGLRVFPYSISTASMNIEYETEIQESSRI